MDRVIRTQIYRIVGIYAFLVGLMVWQNHFIIVGIEANPYLNLLIIGVFLFGSARCIMSITSLTNEKLAFEALQEAYADTMKARQLSDTDPLWRHHRCFEPAVLFRAPRLLGHIFDLAIEEIMRAKSMRISVETMQNLLHAVDRKIGTERSLITYLNGLSIFLGLIGTFIGLMEMVGSVGGIIGGLARSDNASPDSIKQLIRDLEAPLVGMATGFSASLFGLMGSLILGLMGRFQGQAANAVRDELEGWLAGISQIENEPQNTGLVPANSDNDIARFTGLTVAVMGGVRRTNITLARAADAIRLLADRQAEQSDILASVCQQVEKVAGQQGHVREALARTSTLQIELSALRGDMQKGSQTLALELHNGLNAVAETTSTVRGEILASVDQLLIRQSDTLRQTLEMAHRVEESARNMEQESRSRAEKLDGQIRPMSDSLARLEGGLTKVDSAVANSSEFQTKRFEQLGSSLVRFHGLISETSAQHQAGLRTLESGVAQVQGVLTDRLDGQTGEVRAVRNDLTSITAKISEVAAVIDRDASHRSSAELQRNLANNEVMDRIAQHQSDIGHILRLLAENLQSNPQAMATILRDAIGAGFENVTTSLQGANGRIAETLDLIASRQARIAESMDRKSEVSVIQTELRDLGRSIEQGLTSGFKEVSQSFDDTFNSYTDLVKSAQLDEPGEEGLTPSHQSPLEADAPTDLAPYIGELRKIAAKRGPIN